MRIAGADWFEGRWIVATEEVDRTLVVHHVPAFSDLLTWPDLELLVIDIPIGLPDRGDRACDRQARRAIRPRGSSVFPAPIRPILSARSQSEASLIRYTIEQKRCSAQAFAIVPIVAAVDRAMNPGIQNRVREGHPELSFAQMNGGAGLLWPKRTEEGQRERTERLQPQFADLESQTAAIRPRRAVIDLLDALAMLWTARRLRDARALTLPDLPEFDSRGLRMEMVA